NPSVQGCIYSVFTIYPLLPLYGLCQQLRPFVVSVVSCFCFYGEGFVRNKQGNSLQLALHAPDTGRLNRRRPVTPGFSR
ncbi:hypothetical protein WCT84_18180, partial [Pectobacterium brasiliense]